MSNAEETVSTTATISMEEGASAIIAEPSSTSHPMQTSCERVEAAFSEKNSIPQQESTIGLQWLKLDGSSSTGLLKTEEPPQGEQNLRVQLYQPPKVLQAIVEETKIGITPPVIHQALIEEPKVELLSDIAYKAIIEEVKVPVGTITESAQLQSALPPPPPPPTTTESFLSDDDNKDTYESFEDTIDTPNSPSLLPAVDSRCCTSCVRERETQTKKIKPPKRERVRIVVSGSAHDSVKSSNMCMAGNSSDCISSEAPPRKLAVKSQSQSTFKQRQLDLHRHKILVEQRRLELLELKIARERDEMLRDTVLYEKELEIKTKQLRKFTEDRLADI